MGEITYDHVTFEYEPGVLVLKDVNLTISPNEKVALVGPTGAGKTTMINLLCRFYDPQQGAVLIDGHDLRTLSFTSLRGQMGIVPQDSFLFQNTVKANIRYGDPEATDEEIFRAARVVGAHDFILRLPEGYDTVIREGGTNISIGQRQLIAFSRALLKNPRILILDEATSSVDPYTELIIQEGLEQLLENRTSIIIAHRLSTVRNADRIVVIDHGEIVEIGNHQQLMEKGGRYSHLYKMQFREPEIESQSTSASKVSPERVARFQAKEGRPRMDFADPQRFQAIREKMEEFQKLLTEKQSGDHDLTNITGLRQKIAEAFKNREAENCLKLLEDTIETLKNLPKEKPKSEG